ncbi:MAG: YidC/Oxa1 family rane protein insertase [Frankiaceae bacterium]|jgi:YidC/Oxa1 family membrane protein insertase|nr:YidC/Oxa1 family rane protein insertase [Frankiaceae bacterium]
MISFLKPLYAIVGTVLSFLHHLFGPITDNGGGVTWAVSIVVLTVLVRILVFPLFVKQIRSQRAMTTLQPEIKALQEKYKGDRQGLGEATMKLYKEKGVNPVSGCLPLVLQAPAFIALYGTLNTIARVAKGVPGMSDTIAMQGAQAKIFGTPIAAGFNHLPDALKSMNPSLAAINTVTATMILLMGASTFFSARQMMARASKQGTTMGSTGQQKAMLYLMPAMLIVFGFIAHFPLGVLIYMLTSNLWTFGQQHFVIGAMDKRDAAAKGTSAAASGATVVRTRGSKSATPTSPAPAPAKVPPTSGGPVSGLRPGEAGRTRKRPPNTPKGKRT